MCTYCRAKNLINNLSEQLIISYIPLSLSLSLSLYIYIYVTVTLEHKTRYICSNSQKYIVWVKIINFSFMPKIIRILRSCSMKIFCKFLTVNISKINF